jgi:hypothetical protein
VVVAFQVEEVLKASAPVTAVLTAVPQRIAILGMEQAQLLYRSKLQADCG